MGTFSPRDFASQLVSGFVQDEVSLVPDKLELTGGVKLEHNDYTGFEPQPSVRLAWHPTPRHTVWAAWSRAVRTPTRLENHGQIDARVFPPGVFDASLPAVLRTLGSDAAVSERLDAWNWAGAGRPGAVARGPHRFCYHMIN